MKSSAAGCSPTTDAVLKSISAKLQAPGQLRNSRTVNKGDLSFITAELHAPDEKPEAKGDLLTWAAPSANTGEFLAVDVHAREDTAWPPASFDVRRDGA